MFLRPIGLCLGLLVSAGSVFADDIESPPEPDASPVAPEKGPVGPPPTLVQEFGGFQARLLLTMNLAKGDVASPVSVSPDISYGIADDLTLMVVHSAYAIDGFLGRADASLCATGKSKGCDDVYKRGGVAGRLQVLQVATFAMAVDGGVLVRAVDPFAIGFKVGLASKWVLGPLAVELSPNLIVAVNERETGEKELLNLPLSIGYGLSEEFVLFLQTGASMPLEAVGDRYRIPLTLAGAFYVTPTVGLALAVSLPAAAAGEGLSVAGLDGFDNRSATLGFFYSN